MAASHRRITLGMVTILAGGWIAAFTLALAGASLPDASAGRLVALFPPGTPSAAVQEHILAAHGTSLGPLGVPFAHAAYSPLDGFAARLRAEGALLVLPALTRWPVAGICGPGSATPLPLL